MKTLLMAPMFLDEGERLERNIKWLNYYTPLQDKLGYDNIYFVDNASSQQNINKIKSLFPQVIINQKKKSLKRISEHAYGFWYRAFANGIKYAMDNGYDKLIHIDTDVFVLNNKLCNYIKNNNSGWNVFWCERWKFPESTFWILGKDKFEEAHLFMSEDFLEFYPYDLAETRAPWTNIVKDFNGDRWGEICLPQTKEMDYYCQCPNHINMVFNNG